MATAAKAAFGIVLKREGVPIAEILDVTPVQFIKERIVVTNHDSTGGYEESIAKKVIRTGELTFKCNSIQGNAGQIAVKAEWAAETASTYTLTFPDGEIISGEALVTSYEYETTLEEQIIFNMTLKWTGVVSDSVTKATAPSALVITTAILYPAFDNTVYEYVAVSTGDTCTLTLTFATSTAKLYRAGVFVQDLTTDTPSGSLSLGADVTLTELQVVVMEANKADLTYTINVANAAA